MRRCFYEIMEETQYLCGSGAHLCGGAHGAADDSVCGVDGGEGGVISIFAKRMAEGKGITIFGDGNQTRDFVYAGDIADGILDALTTEAANTAYNLSTSEETSLKELVAILSKVSGKEIAPAYDKPREGDIYRSSLNNAKAKCNLRWEPKISLEEGLRRTYEDFVKREGK